MQVIMNTQRSLRSMLSLFTGTSTFLLELERSTLCQLRNISSKLSREEIEVIQNLPKTGRQIQRANDNESIRKTCEYEHMEIVKLLHQWYLQHIYLDSFFEYFETERSRNNRQLPIPIPECNLLPIVKGTFLFLVEISFMLFVLIFVTTIFILL